MSDTDALLAQARRRAAEREQEQRERKPIDYDRARRNGPKLKAALTRAENSKDVNKVIRACKAALDEWDEWGAWPDDWSRWQRALDMVLPWNQRIELEDLR